jgi:hypothetical protein
MDLPCLHEVYKLLFYIFKSSWRETLKEFHNLIAFLAYRSFWGRLKEILRRLLLLSLGGAFKSRVSWFFILFVGWKRFIFIRPFVQNKPIFLERHFMPFLLSFRVHNLDFHPVDIFSRAFIPSFSVVLFSSPENRLRPKARDTSVSYDGWVGSLKFTEAWALFSYFVRRPWLFVFSHFFDLLLFLRCRKDGRAHKVRLRLELNSFTLDIKIFIDKLNPIPSVNHLT